MHSLASCFACILAVGLAVNFSGCQATRVAAPAEPRLGVQAWTFRHYSFNETVEKADALGIRYLQAYPGQRLGAELGPKFNHDMTAAQQAQALAQLKAHRVTLAGYGVVKPRDEAEWRRVFAFAVAMGLKEIVCEPPPEFLPLVDRLSRESGMMASIHNHPPPTPYADPATGLAAVAPYGPQFGLCGDTGHWVRAGFDPVAALRGAAGRLHSVHFKDLSVFGDKKAHDVPWGTGISNAAGQIAELRRQDFSGIVYVEYEYVTPDLEAKVARSVDFFRRMLATPAATR